MLRSATNPRVKAVVRLRKQPAERRERGLFCVDTARELVRALDAGFQVDELFVRRAMVHDAAPVDRAGSGGAPLTEVAEPVLAKMAYRDQPDGFVAVMRARCTDLTELHVDAPVLLVVCSGLEKPGNIGAILRSADAAGASAVLIDSLDADVFNPNVIRASTGAVFSVPIVCASPESLADWLRQLQATIVATLPDGAQPYTATDLTGPCAIVVGREDVGLDPFWRDAADVAATVPMRGTVDSLNVSVTGALLVFEAARQRREASA